MHELDIESLEAEEAQARRAMVLRDDREWKRKAKERAIYWFSALCIASWMGYEVYVFLRDGLGGLLDQIGRILQ
jgi:hypothetical protein